jgi:hypothetical protein
MQTVNIPTAQESSHVEITYEDSAHHFFTVKGIYSEFIPQGPTVNQADDVAIFKRLFKAVPRKRPELWPSDWIPTSKQGILCQAVFGPNIYY